MLFYSQVRNKFTRASWQRGQSYFRDNRVSEARLQGDPAGNGHIQVAIRELDDVVQVDVMDDGIGLPKENRSRLTEPYVTTREKGTGLGLAIVKRIMEEHGGRVTLGDAPDDFFGGKGALVRLSFPRETGGTVAKAAEQVETVGA